MTLFVRSSQPGGDWRDAAVAAIASPRSESRRHERSHVRGRAGGEPRAGAAARACVGGFAAIGLLLASLGL